VHVERPADAAAFLAIARPLLDRDEARNQLPLSIAGASERHPAAYDEARFWAAVDRGAPLAAALRTPPYGAVLADPASDAALSSVLTAVAADDPDVPGVVGNVPYIEGAARTLAAATGRRAERLLSQGVFALRQVREVPRAPGAARIAGERDRDMLRRWLIEFTTEALPEHARERELGRIERTIDVRLEARDAGFWLWEDGGTPVSMSGFGGPTPSGIRIGPVYTPPERRRRGYATTLVADQSRWALDHGHRACFLFTDLANPTSNRIYEEIGYVRVGEAAEYRFLAGRRRGRAKSAGADA
jgi:uncharacterized protein